METLPTNPVVVHDVPEVSGFKSQFVYNFYTPAEAVVTSAGLPGESVVDPTDINVKRASVPRYVRLTWEPCIIKTNAASATQHKNNSLRYSKIIKDNANKIITEDFYTKTYKSLAFNDNTVVDKYFDFLSSNASLLNLIDHKRPGPTPVPTITKENTPTDVALELVNDLDRLLDVDSPFKSTTPPVGFSSPAAVETKDPINARFFTRLNVAIAQPMLLSSSYATFSTYNISGLQDTIKTELTRYSGITEDLPYLYRDEFSPTTVPIVPEPIIIGYLIDKFDVTGGGVGKKIESFVIDSGSVNSYLDSRISYGRKYSYRISSVAVIVKYVPELAPGGLSYISTLRGYLVQSNMVSTEVETIENVPPPPPADLGFKWDYENNQLFIHWSFPANPQRDIKKFQVFRRDAIDKPFELLRIVDFDDSKVSWPSESLPTTTPQGTIVKMQLPDLTYVDEEFKKPDPTSPTMIEKSKFIYTVCSVDAHGYTSNYGPQFEVGFDVFKNKLTVNLVSHSGAPKSYPNMYLQADAFIDAIKVSGPNTRTMKIYFMPEYYEVKYGPASKETREKTITTLQQGGDYRLQLINLDMQESSLITVGIDDKRTTG